MKEETDDYTIGDYVSQHFGMPIEETMTCLTCHEKTPKVFKNDSFILPLEEITQKKIEIH